MHLELSTIGTSNEREAHSVSHGGNPPSLPIVQHVRSRKRQTAVRFVQIGAGLLVLGFLWIYFQGFDDIVDMIKSLLGSAIDAFGAGLSGASTMMVQIPFFMPSRTIMNHQYKHASPFKHSRQTLLGEIDGGGLLRLFEGLGIALIHGPLARFGDTFSNRFILNSFKANQYLSRLPQPVMTLFASALASACKTALMPLESLKTAKQTRGKGGHDFIRERTKKYGPKSLYSGSRAMAASAFAGHYPWFTLFNALDSHIPQFSSTNTGLNKILRPGVIGLVSSLASDLISNYFRVMKVCKQTHEDHDISYHDACGGVGKIELFMRGLRTRLLINAAQGSIFAVVWKLLNNRWDKVLGSVVLG